MASFQCMPHPPPTPLSTLGLFLPTMHFTPYWVYIKFIAQRLGTLGMSSVLATLVALCYRWIVQERINVYSILSLASNIAPDVSLWIFFS